MRFSFGLFCALAILVSGQASFAEEEVPTYQRQRYAAGDGAPYSTGWGGAPGYAGAGYGAAYWGGFAGQAYAGTWYQRPYPYHFDYYRGRFGAQSARKPQSDCPCATEGAGPQ
ncbi:MAG: hypothetical protein GXP26_17615 [Planctomycetes bacterium]|nr:hypothetical protein [Planctomycetota bacterium]